MTSLLRSTALIALGCLALSTLTAQPASAPEDGLAERVEQQIASQAGLDGVRVSDREGTVILEGVVRTPSERDRVIAAAEKVPGVVTVDPRLRVEPAARDRAQIRKDVAAALSQDSATAYIDPKISVQGSVVTLAGQAESATDALLAIAIAEDVRGVSEVVNRLEITDSTRTDAEIQSDLRVELAASIVIDDPIEAEVQKGSVHLRGVVDTAFERSWAIRKAWGVRGVRQVDASDLRINPRHPARSSAERSVSREEARRAIISALRNDPRVRPSQPEVQVEGERVTLAGEVRTLAAKRRAEQLARLVVGVRSVDNQLQIAPGASVSDQELERQADAALDRHAVVEPDEVDVHAKAGQLTLTGQVNSEIEKQIAENLVAALPGATGVINRINVRVAPEYEVGQRKANRNSSPSE